MNLSEHSLAAHTALGNTMVASSRDAGWTSLLVDHHRVGRGEASIETRATPDQTIVVQLTGEQSIEVFDSGRWRRATYRAGTMGLTTGGRTDRLRRRQDPTARGFDKLNLYLPADLMTSTWEALTCPGQSRPSPALNTLAFADRWLWHSASALHRAASEGAPDLYAQSTGQWLAAHLLTCHSGHDVTSVPRRQEAITDTRLARTLEMMSARLSERLTLDALASEAGISRFHFVRCFRERTGQTPFAALQTMRIEAAQTLLASTDLDLGSIASRCGFGSAKALSNAFRRRLSIAPTQWRHRYRS